MRLGQDAWTYFLQLITWAGMAVQRETRHRLCTDRSNKHSAGLRRAGASRFLSPCPTRGLGLLNLDLLIDHGTTYNLPNTRRPFDCDSIYDCARAQAEV